MNLSLKGKIFIIVIGILLIFSLNFYQKEVRNFFYQLSSPIQKVLWQTGNRISDFLELIIEFKNLKKENEELKLELKASLAENIALKEIKKENESLRTALGVGLEKDFKLILAEIIGKDISQDSILINKGSDEGISKDLPVITSEKVLLGRISEVYKNFSKVTLTTNKESTLNVKIAEKEIYGIIKGKGNFRLLLDFIPRDQEIKEGDSIITTSLGGVFPEGLLIGRIEKVKRSDIETFQRAEISPLFEIGELDIAFIIITTKF